MEFKGAIWDPQHKNHISGQIGCQTFMYGSVNGLSDDNMYVKHLERKFN